MHEIVYIYIFLRPMSFGTGEGKETMMALCNDGLYNQALSMSHDIENTFLDLGKILRHLLDHEPELFHKIAGQPKIGRRRAYNLVQINRVFDQPQVSRARLKKLGWTRLSQIAKQMNQDNIEELLSLAEKESTKQLETQTGGAAPINNANCVLKYFSPKDYRS
jgi:hypothetical protein